jgi:serine/threonine-protein kinase RsbW
MSAADPAGAAAKPSWARAFPGTPRQAGAARRFVASLLDGSPFCDDAVLVVSELFTNALLHTDSGKPGGLVVVQVTRWLLGVRVAVTDQGSEKQPAIGDGGSCQQAAESGHGLYLVSRLAQHLGWHDDPSGRTICAILGTHPSEHRQPEPRGQASESSSLPQPEPDHHRDLAGSAMADGRARAAGRARAGMMATTVMPIAHQNAS